MADKNPEQGTWRYKMTVNVDTPEGMKSGSAVREVTFKKDKSRNLQAVPDVSVKGEAVVVDLGKRGLVFATMKGYKSEQDYADQVVYAAFPLPADKRGYLIPYYRDLKDAKATLTPTNYPVLVTFTDPGNPKTVMPLLSMETDGKHPVTYLIKTDHCEELFGQGVNIHSIEMEMTDQPITWGIEQWLPWLSALKGSYLHGDISSREAPLGLHVGNFRKGN